MELPVDPRDPVHNDSPPELFWTTTNAGEAMPGIQTRRSATRSGPTPVASAGPLVTLPSSPASSRSPCVVNTRDGTAQIRTGDRVRVDGRAGTVEILARAG